tara:strand:- start:101 stop:676 length:576 start_codon:yes stop_codon:yes gene_type:complete
MANTKTNTENNTNANVDTILELVGQIEDLKATNKFENTLSKNDRYRLENNIFDMVVETPCVNSLFENIFRIGEFNRIVTVQIEGNASAVKVKGKNGKAPSSLSQYASACKGLVAAQIDFTDFENQLSKDGNITRSKLGAVHSAYKELSKSDEAKALDEALSIIKKAFKALDQEGKLELLKETTALASAYAK